MTIPVYSKQKLIIIFTVISIAKFCCYSGYADDAPGQTISDALLCFSNKIYSGCDEAYRLTLMGNINVAPEATDLFCNGPCLTESQAIRNCIDNIFPDFLFYNKATVRDIRSYALNAGCSNTGLRGNFNVARYIGGEISRADRFPNLPSLYAFILIPIWCLFTL